MWKSIYRWLDERINLKPIQVKILEEPIPGGASWIFVFGSLTLLLFVIQFLTGMFLAIYYNPSPDHAYNSILFIEQEVLFGPLIRGLHHWGASFMMIAIGLHMLQVFLYGAYKKPREFLWMVGVVLFLLTLAFGFSGYLLPWDQKAYWATQVGINMVGTLPWIGDSLIRIIRGGQQLGALTLNRFYALHTLFLPWAVFFLIGLHVFILRRVGPAGPWDSEKAKKRKEPFYPKQVFMDAVIFLFTFCVLFILAWKVKAPLADPANPSDFNFQPLPEWYFLFYYELLKYLHGPWEIVGTVVLPLLFFSLLFLLPFLDRSKKRNLLSRRGVLLSGALFLLIVFGFLGISLKQTFSIERTDPNVKEGTRLYSELGCPGCHQIHGEGGKVGPDLSYVGDHRDENWLKAHFKDPSSLVPGSIMPSYHLKEEELQKLTAYMLSLKKDRF
ncbi:MAG TPA: cytochrome b N-terminal domain-containing protein [Nitrospiria bacterium]|jgi:ubiquinol-cytochrome c reductase cytochrome b subunit